MTGVQQWRENDETRTRQIRLTLVSDQKPGTYELRLVVFEEARASNIKLGIEGADSKGRYLLGKLKVTK